MQNIANHTVGQPASTHSGLTLLAAVGQIELDPWVKAFGKQIFDSITSRSSTFPPPPPPKPSFGIFRLGISTGTATVNYISRTFFILSEIGISF